MFQRLTYHCIGISKEISLTLVGPRKLFLHAHRGLVSLMFLLETGDIPDSDSQIHRSGDDKILGRVELS
jgi:hypothetical protein